MYHFSGRELCHNHWERKGSRVLLVSNALDVLCKTGGWR